MKYVRILLAVALVFTVCSAFSFKKKASNKPVYAFGVATSFIDTVVYYTEIQLLDSIYLDKDGFLPHREAFSNQLKNHLEYEANQPNRTCMIYFADSKSKAEKEAYKAMSKYKKSKSISLEKINPEKFRFIKPEE